MDKANVPLMGVASISLLLLMAPSEDEICWITWGVVSTTALEDVSWMVCPTVKYSKRLIEVSTKSM